MMIMALAISCAEPNPSIPTLDSSDTSILSDEESYISIAELKNRYLSGSHPIIDDLVIVGRVTANDLYGEYRRAMIIEDETAGIELRLDSYDLYPQYPIGSLVCVVCDDLWLGSSGGTVVVGAEPTSSDYVVDYISEELMSRSVFLADDSIESVVGEEITIPDIDRTMISSRILLRGLTFTESDNTIFLSRDSESGRFVETSHILYDSSGNTIELILASTIIYAEVTIPTLPIDLEAIVEYSSGAFQIRITEFLIKW